MYESKALCQALNKQKVFQTYGKDKWDATRLWWVNGTSEVWKRISKKFENKFRPMHFDSLKKCHLIRKFIQHEVFN